MHPNPFPPRCAAKFDPERLLATGGFACVYLARQRGLDRQVAVKLLYEHLLDESEEVSRFLDEAKITASLHHEGIVNVIDHDVESGVPWIAYEYLPGRCLRDMLKHGPLKPRESLSIAIQIAAALEECHATGILHRDIKPENVIESTPGRFKVTDFGIAKWYALNRSHTRTGKIPGTVYYVAPELIGGIPPSAQTDVYALGITLYEMVTGSVPFDGDGPAAVCRRHVEGAIPAASHQVPGTPPAIDRLLFKALAKEPSARFTTARDFREAMEGALAELDTRGSGSQRRVRDPRAATQVLSMARSSFAPAPAPAPRSSRMRAVQLAGLAGALTAFLILSLPAMLASLPMNAAQPFPMHGAALGGSAALALVQRAIVPPPPPRPDRVDERALKSAFASMDAELEDCRKVTMDLVAMLAPLATLMEQDATAQRARAHRARLEKLLARCARVAEPLNREPAAALTSARLALTARGRALAFVTWTQIECVRRCEEIADWSRGRNTLPVPGFDDRSPLGRAHYGDAGVPLLSAFLEAALAGLKRCATQGDKAGPELADLLGDVQHVAWAASQAAWETRAGEALAPRIKAFKAGLSELSGREGDQVRWSAWCMWSWAEAGRAQANGRFYRTQALESLGRLRALLPAAAPRLGDLANRLRATWKCAKEGRT